MYNFENMTITQMAQGLRKKLFTSVDLVKFSIEQIKKTSDINAINSYYEESALKQAKEVDKMFTDGEKLSTLAGIPVVVKDNISVNGFKTTCSSKLLENYYSVYDATVIAKLKQNHAVIVAKANMDEFAMGSSNENSALGIVKNPLNKTRVPGGSSGGAAASVAAGQVPFSLGTDTGGSVRTPASFCGLVGIKPTYGLVSRYGVVAFASSFDQVGPIARTVEDSAIVLNAISGKDSKDSTSEKSNTTDYTENIDKDIKGMKIGVIKNLLDHDSISDDVKRNMDKTVQFFKNSGAEIIEVDFPRLDLSLSVYYTLASAELASNLSRFDGIRYGERAKDFKSLDELYKNTRTEFLGKEVKRRIMLGNFVLAVEQFDMYYKKAVKVRNVLRQELYDSFNNCDVIVTPTTPTSAFKLGEKIKDPLKMYLFDVFTTFVNVVGAPAITVPSGFDTDKMPLGIQVIGNKFEESKIIQVANYFEKNTDKETENE